MRRRDVLTGLAAAGAASLTGCLGGSGASPDPDRSPTATPPPSDSGPHPVTPTDRTFEVLSRACGEGRNEATVRFDGDAVAVDGTVGGRDSCDTARLAEASLLDGELTVVVEVVEEDPVGTVACAQCLTDIEYAFEASVPDGGPDRVRVVHDSADGRSTVAVAEHP